ncbi:MAG TPA: hypothetical protein EYP78_02890 [Candidatus Omnitrophica bacterium]|nr:hypothetical protein [Candidatus Omnitrophota bacterium]
MRNVYMLVFFIGVVFLFLPSLQCELLSYTYLIELGETKFAEQNYSEALHYFQLAQLLQPSSREAMNYINLIKRMYEGRAIREEDIKQLEKEIIAIKRKKKLPVKRL